MLVVVESDLIHNNYILLGLKVVIAFVDALQGLIPLIALKLVHVHIPGRFLLSDFNYLNSHLFWMLRVYFTQKKVKGDIN